MVAEGTEQHAVTAVGTENGAFISLEYLFCESRIQHTFHPETFGFFFQLRGKGFFFAGDHTIHDRDRNKFSPAAGTFLYGDTLIKDLSQGNTTGGAFVILRGS